MVCTSGETGASAAGSNESEEEDDDGDGKDNDEGDDACGAVDAKLDIRWYCCCAADAADDASSGENMGDPMSMVPRTAGFGVCWLGDCSGAR